MHKKLRIISYNCQSFNTKSVIIKNLLESSDILRLQETFITDENSKNFGKNRLGEVVKEAFSSGVA